MRILILGAGGIGGYYGGRLLQAGRDVTFLVRPRRAAVLAQNGLRIQSPKGDAHISAPPTVTSDKLDTRYDLILLSCKAYDLASAIDNIAPAMGPDTTVLPLLNGMAHLDALDAKFGADRVMGGLCMISTTLDADGTVRHLNDRHALSFGERDGKSSARADAIEAALSNANFELRHTDIIMREMWEKWCFIATGAGLTCLMRGSVGDVVAAGGADLAGDMFDECIVIATANGHTPSEAFVRNSRKMLTEAGSALTASMLRDVEHHGAVEADHILADLLRRAPKADPRSLLRIATVNLRTYEARRAREK